MIQPRARLVCPALRWRRGSFRSNRATIDAALAAGVGGFILFGGTRDAVTALTSALRDIAGRPLLLGSDFERGPGQQVKGLTELPPPAALGYLNDLDVTYACGQITGTEARAVGLTWAFAPVCDLDVEPKNPIVQTRSFGADPQVVGAQAAAWIRGCQEHGVLACAKHFPGHGRTTTDSHEGLPVVDVPASELQQADCAPFAAAVQAGVGSVMPAHVAYPAWDSTGSAATFSKPILGYLRDTIRFDGLVVTDAFIMAGATAAAPEGLAAALVSLLLAPDEARQLGEAGRAYAARFPHAAFVDRMEELYSEARQPAAAPAHGRASSLSARPRPASAAAAEAGDTGAPNNLGLLAAVPDPPERAEARTWRTQEAEAGPADAPELLEQFEDD